MEIDVFIMCKNIYFYNFSLRNYTFLPYRNHIVKLPHDTIRSIAIRYDFQWRIQGGGGGALGA